MREQLTIEEIDELIEKNNGQFIKEIHQRRSKVIRLWMEVNSIINQHLLLLLPYRSLLKHVQSLTISRRLMLAKTHYDDEDGLADQSPPKLIFELDEGS